MRSREKRGLVFLSVLSAALFFGTGIAHAQGGALDPTFGQGGVASPPAGVRLNSITAQADGKIVGAGSLCISGCGPDDETDEIAVVRFDANGALDPTFGTHGLVLTQLTQLYPGASASRVLVQPDGDIVVVGSTEISTGLKAVALRYGPDGRLDQSFGSGGIVYLPTHAEFSYLALQTDGKIVVAGTEVTGSPLPEIPGSFVLMRLEADGAFDPNFGKDGVAETVFSSFVYVHALALAPDGKILVGGDGQRFLELARYEPDGSLDAAFGVGGLVSLQTQESSPVGFALQNDGTFLAGLTPFIGGNFALARFHQDGALDHSFGTQGFVITTVGDIGDGWGGHVDAMAVKGDGRVLLGGDAGYGGPLSPIHESFMGLVQYNPDGLLDPSFGNGGVLEIDHGMDISDDLTVQPNGDVVALTRQFTPTSCCASVLVRLLDQGGYNLSVRKIGSGSGLVTGDSLGSIECPVLCSNTLAPGTRVSLTAQPQVGTKFMGWSGDCSGTGACGITMNQAHSVTGDFALASERLVLQIVDRGGGRGTVVSDPAGILCSSTCATTFPYGASVTLTAAPGPRSVFAGWTGACFGSLTSPCQLKITSATTAGAVFAPACVVPNVKGKRLARAERALRRSHCAVGRVRKAHSRKVRRGRVVRQRPHPGKKLPPGSKVSLVISTGKR